MLATLGDDQSFNVMTGASGNALVVINPSASFRGQYVSYDSTYFTSLPYYACSIVSNSSPFASTPSVNGPGPFVNYATQSQGNAPDVTLVSYTNL